MRWGSIPHTLTKQITLKRRRMKRKVVVEHGEQKKIAALMDCTPEMVSYSLAFRKNSKLARAIRKLAIERGGVEVGGNPQKTDGHEK